MVRALAQLLPQLGDPAKLALVVLQRGSHDLNPHIRIGNLPRATMGHRLARHASTALHGLDAREG
eukprot:2175546-Alexandrium_andersonii.AAC.1